ncbi:hypothetical protein [Jeotgalicoccus sp. WY2]|uniref:hypothetical protein n=1 Tax=Jeotgalicoccus sp. WY2 TaxID=2708346 RepID=UPI002020493E|nr:hypothetical protein [Jeotgalicoccus sp. WY2]
MGDLLARGNTHRDVLEKTIQPRHWNMLRLWSQNQFIVVITDENGEIITNSDPVEPEMITVIEHTDYGEIPQEGVILKSNWSEEKMSRQTAP